MKVITNKQALGTISAPKASKAPLPEKGCVKRYILTSAMNNTSVHNRFMDNLEALAEFYDAQILISRTTYFKSGLGALGNKSHRVKRKELYPQLKWDERVIPYLCDDRVQLAPGLLWLGELNIRPTSRLPLSGLGPYATGHSAIIPHCRIALNAVATSKYEPAHHLVTTGTCTVRNYATRKAGVQASFDHSYGAILVEVDDSGEFWYRHLSAEDKCGSFYDLQLRVSNGTVEIDEGGVEAIVWGDIHVAQKCEVTYDGQWFGEGSMIDVLCPKFQLMHDTYDQHAVNHWDNNHFLNKFRKSIDGKDSVRKELDEVCEFLLESSRPWCKTVVVRSNHGDSLDRWILNSDFKQDVSNAEVYLQGALAAVKAAKRGKDLTMLQYFAKKYFKEHNQSPDIKFLKLDQSFKVKGIELGMHGHIGPGGSKGSLASFAKGPDKTITGHSHQAGILHGSWSVAVSASLDHGYNKGPSAWSHTNAVIYRNGKRTMIEVKSGKWRA